jgi:hypothetical protein
VCEWKQAQDRYYRGKTWNTQTNDVLNHKTSSDQSIMDHQPGSDVSVDGDVPTYADVTDSEDSYRSHESPTQLNCTQSTSSMGHEGDATYSVASTQSSGTTPAMTATAFDVSCFSPPPSLDDSSSHNNLRENGGSSDNGSAMTNPEPRDSIAHEEPNPTPLAMVNSIQEKNGQERFG